MQTKRIFKKSLAQKLSDRGNKLIKIEKNKYNPNYKVYIFESTFQLIEDVFTLTNR